MDYLTLRHLSHSGVKGQKWGVRRWQNPDGSLTPEGRIHYGLGESDISDLKKSFQGLYKKNGKVKGPNAALIERSKDYYKTGMYKKFDDEYQDKLQKMYNEYEDKYNARWEKENKNKSDKELMEKHGWTDEDIEYLNMDGYGDADNNARSAIRDWEWTHSYSKEWNDFASKRDKLDTAAHDEAVKKAKLEVDKIADEIFGSDEMIKKAKKGHNLVDNIMAAGTAVTLLTIGSISVADSISAKKDPSGKGFLTRWAERR